MLPRRTVPCRNPRKGRCTPFSRAACAALLAAVAVAALAQPEANGNGDRRVLQEIYAGVVSNQTISFTGHEFYRAFVATWRERDRTERYNLAVLERPSARWGSLIWVEYRNRPVFQAFVSPGRAELKQVAQRAAEAVYQNVVETEVQRMLFRDPDLGGDEF